ncbi:MAG: SAM-dependent methyltransferase, partial [Verrucomicrobiota bacterium]
LAEPGRRDITAHVDFTAVREAIESLGGEVVCFENQSRFLTEVARPWLLGLEGRTDPDTTKLLRNFQTLTHPAQMGSRFHFLEAGF